MSISKISFYTRYRVHIMSKYLFGAKDAMAQAKTAYEDWDGVNTPEECVEEDMSYYGD